MRIIEGRRGLSNFLAPSPQHLPKEVRDKFEGEERVYDVWPMVASDERLAHTLQWVEIDANTA